MTSEQRKEMAEADAHKKAVVLLEKAQGSLQDARELIELEICDAYAQGYQCGVNFGRANPEPEKERAA